jgi:hypothetical protein
MSRAVTGDTVVVKPTNNIYTVLSGVALLVMILGLAAIYVRCSSADLRGSPYLPGGLFGASSPSELK